MTNQLSQKNVLVVGGVSWDTQIYLAALPAPQPQTLFAQRTHEAIGSTGAGKALALHRLGIRTRLHALWGADAAGERIRAAFQQENLHYLHDEDPQGTERHLNLLDEAGQRISIYTQSATFAPEIAMPPLLDWLRDCDILALNIINYCRRLIAPAQALQKPIWCDIHDYDGESSYHQDFIDAADVLFMSSDAMPEVRPFMQTMADAGKQIVVCTHGKQGATALVNGVWFEQAAHLVAAEDPNGAGDNFFAGYLYGTLQGYDPQRCLQLAALTAASCVTSPELIAPDLSAATIEAQWRSLFAP